MASSVERVAALLEKRGILSFDRRDSDDRNAAVANSVGVGVERAENLFKGLGAKAAEISVFPENVAIPTRVLSDLWEMDALDIEEEVLRPLENLSLLRWDRSDNAIRLHMMVHRALRSGLAATAGGPASVHRRLIGTWSDPYRLPHDYAWRWFGWHCVRANEAPKLAGLLLDFEWIRKKLQATEVNALIQEFDCAPDEPRLALIQRALRASAHVLAKRPTELATQLVGRLGDANRPDLQEFLARLRFTAPRPWLRPLTASLAAPGLLRVIRAKAWIHTVAVSSDGKRIVSEGDDGTQTVWNVDEGISLRTVCWNQGRSRLLSIGSTGASVVTTTFWSGHCDMGPRERRMPAQRRHSV